MEAVACFRLHVRCGNCKRVTAHNLSVPNVEDAPREVDELLASAFLERQRMSCSQCQSYKVQLMGATQIGLDSFAQCTL